MLLQSCSLSMAAAVILVSYSLLLAEGAGGTLRSWKGFTGKEEN